MDEYPTHDDLKRIEEWDYNDQEALGNFIKNIWWNGDDLARFEEWKKDERGKEYRMLYLVTGGWSGNEDILAALRRNKMISIICWQSSLRGGLHIFHMRKLEKPEVL